MKKKDAKSRESINAAIQAGEDKLLHNPSRGECILCWVTLIFAFFSLVMSVIGAFGGDGAVPIIRAFTEKPVWFVLIILLMVYDRVLVFRGRSLTVMVFCLLSIASDAIAIVGAGGFSVVMAVLTLLAGVAFYGTLFVDQLAPSDRPLKYRIVYGGALLKLILILVTVIVEGSKSSGAGAVVGVLGIIASGFTELLVIALMICHFDGFGYFRS